MASRRQQGDQPLTRDLDWSGMYGVRDLGGLPTGDGRLTTMGAIVRSESLDRLTDTGWDQLHAYGIRTVVDLRSDFEVVERPYRCPGPDVEVVRVPLEDGLLDDEEFRRWAETGLLSSALYYAPFLARWPGRTASVVRSVAAAGAGGVLFHCQRGRDRTGLVAILLLGLAGVEPAAIVADHFRTDERLIARGVSLGHPGLDGENDLYAEHGTTAEHTLRRLIEDLDVERYLLGAGVSASELTAVAERLVPET